MRTLTVLLALAPLALAACSGSSDPKALVSEGQAALSSGDFPTAAERFDAALAELEASGEAGGALYVEAAIGGIEARIRTAPEEAKSDFLALAQARSGDLQPKDFSYIGNKFASASRFMEAIAVLDAGVKAHGESPLLQKLQAAIKEEATKAGDKDALDAMAGLGYL